MLLTDHIGNDSSAHEVLISSAFPQRREMGSPPTICIGGPAPGLDRSTPERQGAFARRFQFDDGRSPLTLSVRLAPPLYCGKPLPI
jgi:hypothetical protein